MLKKLTLGLLFLLSACNTKPVGADGYTFGKEQYEQNNLQVKVITYNTEAELQKAAAQHGATNTSSIAAFSVLKPPFNTCTIHMINPKISYQPEFIGHEFVHCVYGQWHTNNSSRS